MTLMNDKRVFVKKKIRYRTCTSQKKSRCWSNEALVKEYTDYILSFAAVRRSTYWRYQISLRGVKYPLLKKNLTINETTLR